MDFRKWKKHFEANKTHFDHIGWEEGDRLTEEEKKAIASSIQQFQKGENSEGKNLIQSAKAFVLSQNDKSYVDAIRGFIQEEQSHSRALGKFMVKQSIPFIKDHWVDDLFRLLRRGSNITRAILVLSSAELIATQYYIALREATQSKVLKAICDQILIDEDNHIRFQAYSLHCILTKQVMWKRVLYKLLHASLLLGTTVSVFFIHFHVFKKAQWSFSKFTKGCLKEFIRLQKMILQHHHSNQLLTTPTAHYETSI